MVSSMRSLPTIASHALNGSAFGDGIDLSLIHIYETVTAVFSCAGNEFTAKGKTVLVPGWKEIDQRFRATLKADGEEEADVYKRQQ